MNSENEGYSWGAGAAVVVLCLALGGISGLELHVVSVTHGQPLPWSAVLLTTMPRWVLLAATLPFVLRVGWAPRGDRTRSILLHVMLFLAISGVNAVMVTWTTDLVSPMSMFFPYAARLKRAWYNSMPTIVSLYAAVLVAAWGITEARERQRRTLRAAQLETQLQAARLQALRAKLQPHFLYNTLTGIAALVADSQRSQALAAIEALGELLHVSLRDDGRETVPVSEEVALAERYLELQRMRFGGRLQYTLEVSPDVAECGVPVLLLQPLVENAVVHGMEAGAECLHITIAAGAVAEGVELRVENDGAPVAASDTEARATNSGSGVGIAATRARLITAYGDLASLRLTAREGGGASVRIVVPRTIQRSDDASRSISGSFAAAV